MKEIDLKEALMEGIEQRKMIHDPKALMKELISSKLLKESGSLPLNMEKPFGKIKRESNFVPQDQEDASDEDLQAGEDPNEEDSESEESDEDDHEEERYAEY